MKRGAVLAIVALTAAVYGRSLFHPFLDWDDGAYVTKNPRVQSGDAGMWLSIWDPRPALRGERLEYLPVVETAHRAVRSATGSGPWGFHAANLLAHAAASLAFLLLLARLGFSPAASAWGAALFAVHPLHVEPVVWVSGLKDPLSSLFLFLGLKAFLERRLTGILLFALALGTKGTAVVFVPLALLCAWFVSEGPFPRAALRVFPYAALAGLSSLATMAVARANDVVKAGIEGILPFTMATVVVQYVGKLFVPLQLSAHYKPLPVLSATDPWFLGSMLFLIAAAALLVRFRSSRPVVFGAAWFLLSLLPVLNLVPISTQMADRYLYVALGGFTAVWAWWLADRTRSWRAVLAVLTAAYAALAFARVGVWSNERRLWEDAYVKAPHDVIALNNYAGAVAREGHLALAARLYVHLTQIAPTKREGWNNLGRVLFDRSRRERAPALLAPAERALREAVRIDPEYAGAHNNLGIVLWEQGAIEEARAEFERALKADPTYGPARRNLDALNAQCVLRERLRTTP